MRKDESGVNEWCRHTRNTAVGKRGVNKRNRRAAIPTEGVNTPVSKPTRKPFGIEYRYPRMKGWSPRGWYTTAARRDRALADLVKKARFGVQYRSIER